MRAWREGDTIKLGPDLSRWENVYKKGKIETVLNQRPTQAERRSMAILRLAVGLQEAA